MIVPTWCGLPETAKARIAPFLKLGTVLANTVDVMPYRASLTAFDAHIVNGRRTFMQTRSTGERKAGDRPGGFG
jgi:hypothetical protein